MCSINLVGCVRKIPIFTNLEASTKPLKPALRIIKSFLPYLLILGLVFFIFKIHMSSEVDSMLNERNSIISNGFLTSQITYHKEFAPFARRPLTTYLIEKSSEWFDITLGKAFVWVNFFLMFLSGILLFRISHLMRSGFLKGILNIIIYFLSFSVLFAFFPPLFSYDEPLQYCFIFAGLACYLKRQWAGYVLWFTAAMVARENTALLILGLAFSAPGVLPNFRKIFAIANLRGNLLIALPLLLYLIFIVFFIETYELWKGTQHEFQVRFLAFLDNFTDIRSSIETIISIVLTLGNFIYFLFSSKRDHQASEIEKTFVNAFILSCILNTLVVLVAAFAREARLFSLPLVFLWPLMAQYCSREIKLLLTFKVYLKCFARWKYCITFGIISVVNYVISFKIYMPSFPSGDNYFNEYLFVSLQLMCLHYLLRHFVNRNPKEYTPISIDFKRYFPNLK